MVSSSRELQEDKQWIRSQGQDFELIYKQGTKAQWYFPDGRPLPNLLPADPYHIRLYRGKGWILKPPDGTSPVALVAPELPSLTTDDYPDVLNVEGFTIKGDTPPDVVDLMVEEYRTRYETALLEYQQARQSAKVVAEQVQDAPELSTTEQELIRQFREGTLVVAPLAVSQTTTASVSKKKKGKQKRLSEWQAFMRETRQIHRDSGKTVPTMKKLAEMYKLRNSPPVIASPETLVQDTTTNTLEVS